MSEWKITASHLRRPAVIYVRQSTLAQVERNRESTARQYDLVSRARELGWPRSAVTVIDEDLGMSAASAAGRTGFAELAARVGLGEVGMVLSLECSRLARNNADWYRLLDLAGMTDTLIADADGVYHPALFNDRLLLGMKGTMSEAELHILRARLDGGIRNKAARGELRRGLPAGLVWGEGDGEILLHPDEAVRGVITVIFEQFAVRGSARGVWLHLRDEGLKLPLQRHGHLTAAQAARQEITWVEPTYHAVHNVLTHPAYAGAYTYGRSRQEKYAGQDGTLRVRRRMVPQDQWEVLIKDHHEGFTDWDTYQANQARIRQNIRPMAHQPGTGAVREGCALLQGLATCGTCGRKLAVYYDGERKTTPGYYCTGTGQVIEGRGTRHLRVGGVAIDTAVAAGVPGRPRAGGAAGVPASRPAAGGRPRHGAGAMAPPRRGRPVRRRQGRTPLPGRRPGKPAGRPRPGGRLGKGPDRTGRRRGRARPPRGSPPGSPVRTGTRRDPRTRRRPPERLGRPGRHRQGPQAAAAHPARGSLHHHPPRPRHRARRPAPALERRRDRNLSNEMEHQATNT